MKKKRPVKKTVKKSSRQQSMKRPQRADPDPHARTDREFADLKNFEKSEIQRLLDSVHYVARSIDELAAGGQDFEKRVSKDLAELDGKLDAIGGAIDDLLATQKLRKR